MAEDMMTEENGQQKEDKKAKRERKKAEREEKKRKKKEAEQNMTEDEASSSLGGKLLTFFVTILIVVIWIAIVALLIKMDVGNFGSEVLAPVIKDVPYVNRILPDKIFEVESTENAEYPYQTLDAAIERIKQLEIELEQVKTSADGDASYIEELEEKARELEAYKLAEAEHEALKEKWYQEVVFSEEAPDIENYKEYYEEIAPANAEILYKQVVEQTISNEKIKEYIDTYSTMKPAAAATIFDNMTDDLKLVAEILSNMDVQARADILSKMSSENAAKLTEIMQP